MTFPTSEERRYVLLWGQGTGQRHRVAELLGVWGDSWVDSGRGRGSPIWTTCDLPMPGIPKRARGLGLPWGTRMHYWQEGLALRCGGKPPDSSQNPSVAQKHTRKVNSFGEPRGGPSLNKKPNIHTHSFPRKCVCPSKEHPCGEREGGSGRTQLKMTLRTRFHVYLHSYHHHPVFSSRERAQHSTNTATGNRPGREGRPPPQHHSGREGATTVGKEVTLLHPLDCHPRGILILPKSYVKDKVSKIGLYATWSYY